MGDDTTDPGIVNNLLATVPGLEPQPDELGNMQAVYRLHLDGNQLIATVPVDVTDAAIDAALAGYDAAVAAAAAAAAALVTAASNEGTLEGRLEQQLPILRTAIDAITASPPTLFAGLNNQERVFLRRLARNQADLIKLRLRDLESTD